VNDEAFQAFDRASAILFGCAVVAFAVTYALVVRRWKPTAPQQRIAIFSAWIVIFFAFPAEVCIALATIGHTATDAVGIRLG